MRKMREWWPRSYDPHLAVALREQRERVVDPENPMIVNLEAAAIIKKMNTMPGPISLIVIQGAAVERLQEKGLAWLKEVLNHETVFDHGSR